MTDKLFGKSGVDSKAGYEAGNVNLRNARIMARNMPTYIMEGAKAAGIHPTVALGLPQGSTPAIPLGDSAAAATDFSQIGQDLGNVAQAVLTREDREMQKIVNAQAVERGSLENELLKTQIAQARISMSPGVATSNATELIPGQGDSRRGYAGAAPLHIEAIDEDGDRVRMFNSQDLGDSESAQIAHFLRYSVPDYARNVSNKYFHDSVNPAKHVQDAYRYFKRKVYGERR